MKNENVYFEEIPVLSKFILGKEEKKYINSLLNELISEGEISKDETKYVYNIKSGQ
jgi:hypothetical protein